MPRSHEFYLDAKNLERTLRGRWFKTIAEMQRYVDRVVTDHRPPWDAHVRDKRNYRALSELLTPDDDPWIENAAYAMGPMSLPGQSPRAFIYLPATFRWEVVLLHELAHCFQPGGHSAEWGHRWVSLTDRYMGPLARANLRLVLQNRGVLPNEGNPDA